jgi:hypothetical protein
MKIHNVDEDTILIEMLPTKYYQLWNKWDLYEHLYPAFEKMTFEVEDFPIHIDKLKEYAEELKQNRNNKTK